jgi:hypothetical protein
MIVLRHCALTPCVGDTGGKLFAGFGDGGGATFYQIVNVFIVLIATFDARRSEEDDRVVNAVTLELMLRVKILGHDAQDAGILAVHEFPVAIGLGGTLSVRNNLAGDVRRLGRSG